MLLFHLANEVDNSGLEPTASDITTSKTMDLRTYLHLLAMNGQIYIIPEMNIITMK